MHCCLVVVASVVCGLTWLLMGVCGQPKSDSISGCQDLQTSMGQANFQHWFCDGSCDCTCDAKCLADRQRIQACCSDPSVGVASECMPLCRFDPQQQDMLCLASDCFDDFKRVLFCASEGQPHLGCCRRAGVPQVCMDMCAGKISNTNQLFSSAKYAPCLQSYHLILQCHEKNLKKTPQWQNNVPQFKSETLSNNAANTLDAAKSSVLCNDNDNTGSKKKRKRR